MLALAGLATAVGAGTVAADTRSETARPARATIVAQLPGEISVARMRRDLQALERIADRNGGNRAAGTQGYTASVRYVVTQLRRAGYAPKLSPFPFVEYLERVERGRQLSPVERDLAVEALEYSPSTPQGGIRSRLVPSGDGCDAADFDAVSGLVAIVERGSCFFSVKAANAQAAGAAALVVFNNEDGPFDGTLGDPQASRIPVAGIARSLGQELVSAPNAVVELELVTRTSQTTSQNVIADTRRAPKLLLVGAHLDSVREGAGINDNATGVVAVLEIARALKRGSRPLAVRFAFWGAEELGLIGSRAYAPTVSREKISGYLNFDVLGSPTREYGVYGADAYAGRWLRYLDARDTSAARLEIGDRSDHAPFAERGFPVAGLYAGGYPCYHQACDRVANVDFTALGKLASAAAFGVASFAPLER